MKKQHQNRNYNTQDADLYQWCMEVLRLAQRDMEVFAQYGFTHERLNTFKVMCDVFQQLPDDNEMVGDQMISTEKKNQSAESLRTAIRGLMTRVALKFHDKTGRYRKFGTAKLGDMTDPQLLFCGRRVVRVARAQIDFLAEAGVNEQILKRVTDACTAFENALNIQQDRLHERDIAVERRMEQGNKIYAELVTVCNVGKDAWASRDRVKYDQYCVYDSNNDQKIQRKQKAQNQ